MGDIAGWFAPIATMIAACVTAANLGARVTGWGFVIFTFGSIAWTAYGFATDQPNLLWQNLALTAVNLVGIWRWLIRQARLDDWARAAAEKSERRTSPTLFPASSLTGAAVTGRDGADLGTAVDAMVSSREGQIAYLVVDARAVAALGTALHILPWSRVRASAGGIETDLDEGSFGRLELADAARWPTRMPRRDNPPD